METKPHLIALLMLALFALTACSGKKTDAAQKTDTEENPNALIQAAAGNDITEARRLIAAGADVSAQDNEGKTALMIAPDCGSADVAELLKPAGAR